MKRLFILFLIFCVLLTGCSKTPHEDREAKLENVSQSGLWISYNDLNNMLLSEKGFLNELNIMIENCDSICIDEVYIQVRPFCDSLYPSKFFPMMKNTEKFEGDVFKTMLESFHEINVKVHAWINPYRVQTSSSDISFLNPQSPVFKWLNDDIIENDINVCFWEGIYLNPSESEVQKLIIDGIREILNNYDVDGIHFDDYFYPTTDSQFDNLSYEEYSSLTDFPISLADWRRANVNSLLSGCYSAIKNINSNVIFSISPAASIEKNYEEFYADIDKWINGGYVDALIPQLYFGFKYSDKDFCFENLLKEWKKLIGNGDKVKLQIGLAPYKIGTVNDFDGSEWMNENDIISRQARICHNDEVVSGYIFFSYSSLFSDEELNKKQLENYRQFLKEKTGAFNG